MPHSLVVIGSIVGLITGIYTLFDRLFVRRPSLWVKKVRNSRIFLRVQNHDSQDIALIGNKVWPRIYAIANANQLDAMVDAATDSSPYRMIAPDSVVDLPLMTLTKDGKPMDDLDCMVWIWIFWRRTGSMRFRRIPLCTRLRTTDVTLLSGAEIS